MADKTPVRVVYNNSNVATGMAEYQSGDGTHGVALMLQGVGVEWLRDD